jgi:hypothetical protein
MLHGPNLERTPRSRSAGWYADRFGSGSRWNDATSTSTPTPLLAMEVLGGEDY